MDKTNVNSAKLFRRCVQRVSLYILTFFETNNKTRQQDKNMKRKEAFEILREFRKCISESLKERNGNSVNVQYPASMIGEALDIVICCMCQKEEISTCCCCVKDCTLRIPKLPNESK